jgi:hypothetical protein
VAGDFIAKLKNIEELGIQGCWSVPDQLRLHPQHHGLTRLRLARFHTLAADLINVLTKCPSPVPGNASSGSPLVEVVLFNMILGPDWYQAWMQWQPTSKYIAIIRGAVTLYILIGGRNQK